MVNHPLASDEAGIHGAEDLAQPTPLVPMEFGLFHPRVLFPFLLVSLIWGSTWLVIKDQIANVPPAWSVSYRFFTAAVGMAMLGLAMRIPLRLDRKGHLFALVIGLVQFAFNFNLVYGAEHHITSGLVAVIFALLIIPNALLGKLWLGKEAGGSFWPGSAIAALGVALLIMHEYRVAPLGRTEVIIGASLSLAAVLCASVSNVMQAHDRLHAYPTIAFLAWAMLYGALGDAVWAFVQHGPPVIDMRPSYLAGVAYLGIVGTVVTFPLYFRLIRDVGPGKAAYTSVLIPVVAMGLSTLFEGYRWSLLAGCGAVLVLAGLLVAMQARRPSR